MSHCVSWDSHRPARAEASHTRTCPWPKSRPMLRGPRAGRPISGRAHTYPVVATLSQVPPSWGRPVSGEDCQDRLPASHLPPHNLVSPAPAVACPIFWPWPGVWPVVPAQPEMGLRAPAARGSAGRAGGGGSISRCGSGQTLWNLGKGGVLTCSLGAERGSRDLPRQPAGSLGLTAAFHPVPWGPGRPSSSGTCRT